MIFDYVILIRYSKKMVPKLSRIEVVKVVKLNHKQIL